jgi:hypothetical protein
VRDVLAHGAALPESIPVQLVDSALASFIALCLKYDIDNTSARAQQQGGEAEKSRDKEEKLGERAYVVSLNCDTITKSHLFVANYQPAYHPRAYLKERMKKCYAQLIHLKTLDERLKASPVPNGLKPQTSEGADETSAREGGTTFTLEGVEAEAVRMAQQLQEAIMKRYGALCFLPGGFLPIDYVLLDGDGRASEERERTEIEEEEVGSKYRMTAHFSLREQSKVEILSTLADQVASFLREVRMGTRLARTAPWLSSQCHLLQVAEKYSSLYDMVASRKVPLQVVTSPLLGEPSDVRVAVGRLGSGIVPPLYSCRTVVASC